MPPPWGPQYEAWYADLDSLLVGTMNDVRGEFLSTYPKTLDKKNRTPGRQLRVFAQAATFDMMALPHGTPLTLSEAYAVAQADPVTAARFAHLPVTVAGPVDPQLPSCLQDLAWMIGYDLTEACAALDDPDCWYPGVDEGIDPVPDAHIDTVIEATQRELNRELRHWRPGGHGFRPAVPLAELPRRVQRAFVERRRLRYREWGIDRVAWERGTWSLWDVREDEGWVPPWVSA